MIWAAVLLVLGCEMKDHARNHLTERGYSNVEWTGWALLTCGQEACTATGFRAVNAAGDRIEGAVCCGLVTCNVIEWPRAIQ